MKRKIFGSMVLISLITIILTAAAFSVLLYQQLENDMERELKNQMALVMTGYGESGIVYLQEIRGEDRNSRITLIAPSGKVLYDNRAIPSEMENHKDRLEVKAAFETGKGEGVRNSDTLGSQFFYLAQKTDDGNVLRLSIRTDSIRTSMGESVIFLVGILLLIGVLAMVFSRMQTRRIIQPINDIDLEHPEGEKLYEELFPLVSRIHNLNQSVQDKMRELSARTDNFNRITSHMEEGLIILDRAGKIITINRSAARFFEVEEDNLPGKHFSVANRNLKLLESVEKTLKGQHQEEIIEDRDRQYQLRATPVFQEEEVSGGILMLYDVTEKRRADNLRREFTANVSHELKTPLTSILGYAEILSNRMAEGADAIEFAGRIQGEAKDLLSMIEDIIRLSELDEGNIRIPMERVNLLKEAERVAERLRPTAALRGIPIEVIGEEAFVQGIPTLLEEMLVNLMDNSIKYNVEEGEITARIQKAKDKVVLEVADTGIGIPLEDQERIFERFYRVDKSHSKNISGTGLGLSIVKHIAAYHKAALSLESQVGKGTTIRIEFQAD
ncbi:MAG TPA: ATP-binding protein [Bacillota bacterium]|nr:ATP-binding protein [Bacillota bacterium]